MTGLEALAAGILRERDAILGKWRVEMDAAGEATIIRTLSRADFYDHIPQFLDCFCASLQGDTDRTEEPARRHGAHRWQQGLDFEEVVHEWNLLHRVLIDRIAALYKPASLTPERLQHAYRLLADEVQAAIAESLSEFDARQRLEAEARASDLEVAIEQREELDKRRGRILHETSHDLRGSLHIVRLSGQLLRQRQLDRETSAIVERLCRASDSLHQLFGNLLDLARLEAGREEYRIGDVDAAALLRELCDEMQPAASAQGLSLRARGPNQLPVRSDPEKLRRIAQNLILNALKYTAAGSVEVGWQSESPRRWSLYVHDTGPGLPALAPGSLAAGLEDATTGAAHAVADCQGDGGPLACLGQGDAHGEGIGLAIVHKLCELLGAVLEVSSEPARGATFTVLLPLDKGD